MRPPRPALQRNLSALVRPTWLLLALGSIGCVRHYRPPTADEPHAVLKVRRSYAVAPGSTLREMVDLDEHRAFEGLSSSRLANEARGVAVLVHPVPASVAVRSEFFHSEMRLVQESYTETVPRYETETYDCSTGFGATRNYRTCTRPVTRYSSELKYRWVHKQVDVSDGACTRTLRFAPVAGHVYLLQYTYYDHGACSLSCFEQQATGPGQFRNAPCPAAPPG